MEWTALNEYLISDAGAFVKKTSVTQQAEGVGNREVVLEHEVYDIIANTHLSLLHDGQCSCVKYDLHCSSRCYPSHSCPNTTREMEMEDAEEMGDRHADIQCLVQFMSVSVNVYAVPRHTVRTF